MRLASLTLPLLLCLAACSDPATQPAAPPPAEDGNATEQPAAPEAPETEAPPETPEPTPSPEPGPTAEVPARFQGSYAGDAAACTRQGDESHLQLQAKNIAFHESSGEVTAVEVDGDAIAITAQLSGEGETWERVSRFRLQDSDNVLVDSEHGMRRVRCPAG